MKFHADLDQGSEKWRKARSGKPTASNFKHIITELGNPVDSKERNKYKYRLVAERILEIVIDDDHTTPAMQRGLEMEEPAAHALENRLCWKLQPGAFVTTDDDRFGCSPDRVLVRGNKREAVEIKCPVSPAVQIQYMCEKGPDKYKPQVQGQLFVGEYAAVHFWSWHPKLPPVYVYTTRDEDYIRKLSNLLDLFNAEVDAAEMVVRRAIKDGIVVGGKHNEDDPLAELLNGSLPLKSWKA